MKFKLNKFLIEDFEMDEHPTIFEKYKGHSILILRVPKIKKTKIQGYSYAFYIKSNKIYLFNRKNKDFKLIGGFNDLYEYLDKIIDNLLLKITQITQEIDLLEDSLFEEGEMDINKWLNLKKNLSFIERLFSNIEINFERFYKEYKDKLDQFAYSDLKEHITRIHKLSTSYLKKLDYTYNFYKTKVDERTNNIMFVLTIISGIFMPLTLITGFFGMNTGSLPFADDINGTLKVTIIMIIFEIPFLILIWLLSKKKK